MFVRVFYFRFARKDTRVADSLFCSLGKHISLLSSGGDVLVLFMKRLTLTRLASCHSLLMDLLRFFRLERGTDLVNDTFPHPITSSRLSRAGKVKNFRIYM